MMVPVFYYHLIQSVNIAFINVLGSVDRVMNRADGCLSPRGLLFWIAVLTMLPALGFNLRKHANAETTSYCYSILTSEGTPATVSHTILLLDHKAHVP